MPSDLPVIKIRTNPDNVVKIKYIAKKNKRSVSKEIEMLIEQHITEFEQKSGEIKINFMTPLEIAEDVKDRITKKPPYGDIKQDGE